jgi:hydroxypyruvate isomerase
VNLALACDLAAAGGMSVVIEPLSAGAAPDYHVGHLGQALATIEAVAAPNLRLMLDCFHTELTEGDVIGQLRRCLPVLGHVQISSVPDRAEPDHGDVDYELVLAELDALGYEGFVGAEYRPATTVEDGLGWLDRYQNPEQGVGT